MLLKHALSYTKGRLSLSAAAAQVVRRRSFLVCVRVLFGFSSSSSTSSRFWTWRSSPARLSPRARDLPSPAVLLSRRVCARLEPPERGGEGRGEGRPSGGGGAARRGSGGLSHHSCLDKPDTCSPTDAQQRRGDVTALRAAVLSAAHGGAEGRLQHAQARRRVVVTVVVVVVVGGGGVGAVGGGVAVGAVATAAAVVTTVAGGRVVPHVVTY